MSVISKAMAEAIVREIGREVEDHVNLMDDTGRILASTDPVRVGMVHDGARKILEENLDEYFIEPGEATETTRVGLNFAIRFRGEIVGVIGITGSRESVYKYGKIVRRMTEILLEENLRLKTKSYRRRIIHGFLEEWMERPKASGDPLFIERGKVLGIDVTSPRRCLALRYDGAQELAETLEGQQTLSSMNHLVRDIVEAIPGGLYCDMAQYRLCFLPAAGTEDLRSLYRRLSAVLDTRYGICLLGGFDSREEGSSELGMLRTEAAHAANAAHPTSRPLVGFGELTVELLLDDVTEERARLYLSRFFGDQSEAEIAEWMEIIGAYFELDGSITRMSDRLFTHKNTLQYRIKRLAELTGFDLRRPDGAARYFAARYLWNRLHSPKWAFTPGER